MYDQSYLYVKNIRGFHRFSTHMNSSPIRMHHIHATFIKVTLWSLWSRQVGGYFLLDYSVTYMLSCFVLCCTCLMFDCVRKVVGKLANIDITITLQRS